MKIQHLKASSYRCMPWKNGAGITTEILINPAEASLTHMDWRLSMAPIKEKGAFSLFPGFDRLLTLLEGESLGLRLEEKKVNIAPGQILAFRGEQKVEVEDFQGEILDLGLIFRRPLQAQMHSIAFKRQARSFSLTAKESLFFIRKGGFATSIYPGEKNFALQAGDTLHLSQESQTECIVLLQPTEEESCLIAVEID